MTTTAITRRRLLAIGASSAVLLAAPAIAQGAKIPLRIGFASVGVDNRQFGGSSSTSVLHVHKGLEKALEGRGDIQLSWHFFKGAGPAVNEALASRQLDFAHHGDLPSITGRSNGLDTRILAITRNRTPTYIAARNGLDLKDIAELKGRKVGLHFGTNPHLVLSKILSAAGLRDRDIDLINLNSAASKAALVSGDVDAAVGDVGLFDLQDQGLAHVFYTTKDKDPRFERYSHFHVDAAFDDAHPEISTLVVRTLTEAAHWASLEENREAFFELSSLTGEPIETFHRDFADQRLIDRNNPLLDEFVRAQYRTQAALAREYGLLRRETETDSWFKPAYLDAAIADLGLAGFWETRNSDGTSA